MLAVWTRLLRLGVGPDTSPSDAQRIALTNAITAFAAIITAATLPSAILARDPLGVTVNLAAQAGFAAILGLQARGRTATASTALVGTALLVLGVLVAADNLRHGGVQYLLVLMLLPFLIFSTRHTGRAVAVALVAFALATAAVFVTDSEREYEALLRARHSTFLFNSASVAVLILVLGIFSRRTTTVSEACIAVERAHAEALLTNVFPAAVARRLKRGDAAIADRFGDVSVLFCRVLGLDRIATLEQLAVLGELFQQFDDLCERHGVEKIKSFGESYMVAAGLPVARPDHAEALVALALDMKAAAAAVRVRLGRDIDVRIGINSGPVVAGVMGRRRYTYDLWGDVVNTAERMQSHGLAGEIQISAITFAKVNHRFRCEPREVLDIKGKLPVRSYLVRAPLHLVDARGRP